jgi:hypothetical protein
MNSFLRVTAQVGSLQVFRVGRGSILTDYCLNNLSSYF